MERERRKAKGSNGDNSPPTVVKPEVDVPYDVFPRFELDRLMEVKNAMSSEFPDECSLPVSRDISDMFEGFNHLGVYVSNVVKFCKQIPAFEWMKHEDQLSILKRFFFDILAIRFSFSFDVDRDVIPIIEVRNYSFLPF